MRARNDRGVGVAYVLICSGAGGLVLVQLLGRHQFEARPQIDAPVVIALGLAFGRIGGTFPGSPIQLRSSFTLDQDIIVGLEIAP